MIGISMKSLKSSCIRSKRVALEQYYTKTAVAKSCLERLQEFITFEDYDVILEPSAGQGVFFQLLPTNKRVGFDIDPKYPGIEKIDFLNDYRFFLTTTKHILTIGNPPFGQQSKYAVAFFNHAASFSDTIAFIVPISWEKYSVQRRLDGRFKLIYSYKLEPNSFTFDDQDYCVNCCFQIWTLRNIGKEDVRTRKKPTTTHPDFSFLPKNRLKEADFLMIVCGARKRLICEVDAPIAVQTTERIKAHVGGVREVFEKVDWSKYAHGNTGTMWINRETVVKEYEQIKKEI